MSEVPGFLHLWIHSRPGPHAAINTSRISSAIRALFSAEPLQHVLYAAGKVFGDSAGIPGKTKVSPIRGGLGMCPRLQCAQGCDLILTNIKSVVHGHSWRPGKRRQLGQQGGSRLGRTRAHQRARLAQASNRFERVHTLASFQPRVLVTAIRLVAVSETLRRATMSSARRPTTPSARGKIFPQAATQHSL